MIGFAVFYVVKVKLHINLVKSYSLTDQFPVLARIEPTTVEQTTVGPLVTDSFEPSLTGDLLWANLWSREPKHATMRYVTDESTGSRCLQVDSQTELDWSYVGFYNYRVHPGEVFRISVDARYDGDQRLALIVDAYGTDRKILRWEYSKLPIDRPGKWHTYEKEFTVDELPTYLKIRLEGRGRGQSRFDNVQFERLK